MARAKTYAVIAGIIFAAIVITVIAFTTSANLLSLPNSSQSLLPNLRVTQASGYLYQKALLRLMVERYGDRTMRIKVRHLPLLSHE